MFRKIALFALVTVSLASAKNYKFIVAEPSQVGNVQLKPGEYTLKIDGTAVVLMDSSGRHIEAPAKVESGDEKFEQTKVTASKTDGTNRIQAVVLGGSKTKVVFQ